MSERLDRIEKILEQTAIKLDNLAVSQKETSNQIKKLATQVGGFEKTHSNIIEDLFFNSLYDTKTLDHIKYDTMEMNKDLIIDEVLKTEIDIILYNTSNIAVIEVKGKPKKRNFKQIKKKIEIYKKLHKNDKRTIRGYLASFKFSETIKKEAIKQNIDLMTIKGEIVETKEFKNE